jgi:nucleoside phosphorylase
MAPTAPADVAIITIREDEYRAILSRFPTDDVEGTRLYSITSVRVGEVVCRVACAASCEQGSGSAQDLARDMIDELDPQVILLVGIAGATAEFEFTLGDVVLAKRVHDFCVSAALPDGREYQNLGGGMHPEIQHLIAALPALTNNLGEWNRADVIGAEPPKVDLGHLEITGDEAWRRRIQASLQRHFATPRRPLVTGRSIASGNLLVKDPRTLQEWLKAGARDLGAVEMELAGVYQAARRSRREYPVLAVRGISDVVGLKRDDAWTAYASKPAASFARAFLELLVRKGRLVPRGSSASVAPSPRLEAVPCGHALEAQATPAAAPSTSALEGLLPFLCVIGFVLFRAGVKPTPSLLTIVEWAQAAVIGCLWCLSRRRARHLVSLKPAMNEKVRGFLRGWVHLWVVWLTMYLAFAVGATVKLKLPEVAQARVDSIVGLLANTLNNLQSVAFVLLYACLSSVPDGGGRSKPRGLRYFVLGFAAIDLVCWALPGDLPAVVMAILSGITATAALALFAGRLEDWRLDCGWWFLAAMFVYSGAQLLYPILRTPPLFKIENAEDFRIAVKLYALGMKIGLWFAIDRLLELDRIADLINKLKQEAARPVISQSRSSG